MTVSFIIPPDAFHSLEQYKAVKKYIKEAVREQQNSELKTPVLGHFFHSMLGAWFSHIQILLKMFVVWLAVVFGFLLIMAVIGALKT